jgi:glyoxylase-like metal-dependent hydrolase (beta-lactamase superfamily II)
MAARRAILIAILVAAAAVAVAMRAQEPDLTKVEIKTEKIAAGVFMLSGAGGNIGVSVGPDGVFLIDDDLAPLTDKVLAAVKAISPNPVRFVVNTHWHFDHTGGNENLGKAGSLIVAHDNVRVRMSSDQFIEQLNTKVPASPKVALPVVTFASEVTFHLNGDEIHAFHVPPAHTDGDAIVRFRKASVVHMGDLYFNGGYPFVDLASGGSVEGTIAAADRTLAMISPATRVIPGHGPLGNASTLRDYRDLLVAVRDRIRPMIAAGKTLADVKAAAPTKDFDAKWGQGFVNGEQLTEAVFRSYGGK